MNNECFEILKKLLATNYTATLNESLTSKKKSEMDGLGMVS